MPEALTTSLRTSAQKMGGGVAATSGVGAKNVLTFGGSWVSGEKVTLLLTDNATGTQTQIGAGNVSNIVPSFCFTFNDKEYVLASATVFFSALASPITFNNPD